MSDQSEPVCFALRLVDVGEDRLKLMMAIRAARPGCSLAEAKDLVDGAPKILWGGLAMEEASMLRRRFDGLASVEIVNEDRTPIDTSRRPTTRPSRR